jgi:hypothetical protein
MTFEIQRDEIAQNLSFVELQENLLRLQNKLCSRLKELKENRRSFLDQISPSQSILTHQYHPKLKCIRT